MEVGYRIGMKIKFEIPHCEICQPRLNSVLSELNRGEIESLDLHKGCNFYRAGQVLFYEGNYPSGLFCMNKGKVKVYKADEFGKEQIVRLAKDGDVLGYRALLTGGPYSATAEVLEDATICFVPKDAFLGLLKKSSTLSMKIIQLLGQDLAKAEQKELSLSRKPVRERLAETLLMLREYYGCEEDQATIKGTMSREDLANIVGTAPETVIRLLSEFKHENIIDLIGKKIKILNHAALIKTIHAID